MAIAGSDTQSDKPAPDPKPARIGWPLALMLAALALELVLIMPFADHLADDSSTFHFTQHGLIFLGGIAIGVALREAYVRSRR